MIDASRSPKPVWQRLLTAVILIGAILTAAWLIWVKELHHSDIHVHAAAAVVTLASARTLSGTPRQ